MAEHTRLASLLVMITAAGFLLGALLFTLANTSSSGVRSPGVTVTGQPTNTITDPSTLNPRSSPVTANSATNTSAVSSAVCVM